MRLKSFILPLLFVAVLLEGCDKNNPVFSDPVIEVPESLALEAAAGSQTIQIKATRAWKATISYEGSASDWLSVSPDSDAASEDKQEVTFTSKENTGRERVAKVKFSIGLDDATIVVTQSGPGGTADPVFFNDFDKAAAVKEGDYFPYLSQTECWKNEKGTGIGTISYVADDSNKATVRNNSFSSGSGVNNIFFGKNSLFCVKDITLPAQSNFTISFYGIRKVYEAKPGESVFDHSAFKIYISADNKKWVSLDYSFDGGDPDGVWAKASSTFTLPEGTGKLSIYFPTPTEASVYRLDDLLLDASETGGTVIDFSQGEDIEVGGGDRPSKPGTPSGTGTQADPFNPSAAIAKAKEVGETASSETYYIKGFISSITEITDATGYGNATFEIIDTKGGDTEAFLCYRVKYIGGVKFPSTDAIQVGDEVVVKAKLVNYKGNTPETSNGEMVSINGQGDTGDGGGDEPVAGSPEGTGTQDDPFNATAAINQAKANGTTAPETVYFVKGFVSKIEEISDATGFGNASFYITDKKGENLIPLYCYRTFYFEGEKFPSTDAIQVGDEVVVKAQLFNYNGNTPETKNGKMVSINDKDETAKFFTVSPLSITAGASATTAQFNVSANVSWTAACDNAAFTLGQTAGDGGATVSVTFEANSGAVSKVANITVSTTEDVSTKSYTVVLTQNVPSTGGGYTKINSASEITPGEYIVTFEHEEIAGKVYAMKTDAISKNPAGVEIPVTSGVIDAADGEMFAWTVTGNNNDGFTFKCGDNFLGSSDAAQGIVIGKSNKGKWVFSDDNTYGLLAKNKALGSCSRCLAAYNNSGTVTFRFYKTDTNFKGKLVLYKSVQ